MKKKEIDNLIKESLNKDEAEFYNSFEEEGFFKMMTSQYRGKMAWMAYLTTAVHLIVVIIAVYCGYQLFTIEGTAEILRYGSVMFIALMFASMIKLWHWMQIDKNSMLREMKRIEFQIALLLEKTSDK